MNPAQWLNERVMREAAARIPAVERAVVDARNARLPEQQKEFAARKPETMARDVAQYLNRWGTKGDDYGDSPLYSGFDLLQNMMGNAAGDAANVNDEQLRSAVQQLNTAQKGAVGRVLAESSPGMMEQVRGAEVGFNRALADTGTRGKMTRLGLFTGIGAGTTAGLTAAGQGLMALMDYLQQGQQAAEERNNELA
jgi:hypothetical protein